MAEWKQKMDALRSKRVLPQQKVIMNYKTNPGLLRPKKEESGISQWFKEFDPKVNIRDHKCYVPKYTPFKMTGTFQNDDHMKE